MEIQDICMISFSVLKKPVFCEMAFQVPVLNSVQKVAQDKSVGFLFFSKIFL